MEHCLYNRTRARMRALLVPFLSVRYKKSPSLFSSAGASIFSPLTTSNETPTRNDVGSVALQFHHDNSVAVITLQNPRRRNALTLSMMEQLDMHVQSLSRWSNNNNNSTDGNSNTARAVILTGSDGTFCSGLDLHDNHNATSTIHHSLRDGKNMLYHMTRLTNQILSLPVLSISAIDGYAVGGGAELTTCTDLVVMSRDSKIQFVHAKRGASPGWGGLRRLIKKVGRERALRMLLLGECVLGEEEAQQATAADDRGRRRRATTTYADFVAEEGETALNATERNIIQPLLELPCSQTVRAIKKAVSCIDGDGEVMDDIKGTLKLDTNIAMMGEKDAFLSLWGGKANVELIQKTRDKMQRQQCATDRNA